MPECCAKCCNGPVASVNVVKARHMRSTSVSTQRHVTAPRSQVDRQQHQNTPTLHPYKQACDHHVWPQHAPARGTAPRKQSMSEPTARKGRSHPVLRSKIFFLRQTPVETRCTKTTVGSTVHAYPANKYNTAKTFACACIDLRLSLRRHQTHRTLMDFFFADTCGGLRPFLQSFTAAEISISVRLAPQ